MTDIEQTYARCFSTPSGRATLSHLRQITLERVLGANASDAELRWAESQRSLVRYIERLVSRGRGDDNVQS